MDIRSSLDGLKSLLGTSQATPVNTQPTQSTNATSASALGSDSATLSSAASEMLLTAGDPTVRADKVSSIQTALAAGAYNVPASAVASKMVDSMLGNQS
jgi:flagellar biosynthesis anti-sigma factor FlgM